ncbi:amiloride-sensitive sodium channel subunit gamma [Elysia marginata]|uniref:Amiloride-sensitive sodium channel subunit gamma n=1 Tax=Elysia marginata TaxID=1093978 RepID=A0AAV4GCI0_9GAST|nr:amiloride-sensitive sodium channel subunit gamma [Elysia marginata]
MADKEKNVYTNPNSKHNTNDDDSDNEDSSERPKGIVGVFSKFADKCSLSGVPFITQAENRVVRVIWSCLLLAAFGLMTFHLYKLVVTYFEYKKQTGVQLSFSNLQFPAVTICNVNPMRMSQRDLASDELTQFIDSVDPDAVKSVLETWTPDLEDVDDDYYEEEIYEEEITEEEITEEEFMEEEVEMETIVSELKKDRRKRQAKKTARGSNSNKKQGKGKVRSNNFFDDVKINKESTIDAAVDDYFHQNDEDSWEAESDTSGFYELDRQFRQLLALQSTSKRTEMGHQINDMLLQCSFAGGKCVARNFTRSLTSRYGNCYTLQYPKFISRSSNPSDGLQLKLFLETDDYVPGIANSKGVQVVVHDQGTLPFPEEEGMAVKAGTETFIGLRRVEVSRLGDPYGECTPVKDFRAKYGIKYTRTACQKVCRESRIRHKCGCYDIMQQEINNVLKRPRSLKPCKTTEQIQCALQISTHFEKNTDLCDCHRPCTETTFEKTISSRNWPNPAFANLLSTAACKYGSSVCDTLPDKDVYDLREEFVKLVIYYEDLNYEELKESADYEAIDGKDDNLWYLNLKFTSCHMGTALKERKNEICFEMKY